MNTAIIAKTNSSFTWLEFNAIWPRFPVFSVSSLKHLFTTYFVNFLFKKTFKFNTPNLLNNWYGFTML